MIRKDDFEDFLLCNLVEESSKKEDEDTLEWSLWQEWICKGLVFLFLYWLFS